MMDSVIILLAGTVSALVTFYLNNRLQLGGVMASAGVSLVAGGFFYLFPAILNEYLSYNLPLVIMGASFIGMATLKRIKFTWVIGAAGLFLSAIFLVSGPFFNGYGGSLGTTAAISLCAAYALSLMFKKISPNKLQD